MNEFYVYEEEDEVTEVTQNPRDYNYRRHHKLKEQERRKMISELRYWPTMPITKKSDKGDTYYLEGEKSNEKAMHKRLASRAARQNDEFADNGSTYKKHYDLWWEWF